MPPSEDYGAPHLCDLEEITLGSNNNSNAQWIGLIKVSALGAKVMNENFNKFFENFSESEMLGEFIKYLLSKNVEIKVRYSRGRWFDVDNKKDLELLNKRNLI